MGSLLNVGARALQANQTALNTSAAKAMGETASDLGEGTFNAAKTRIGGEFDRLGQITQPKLGNDFINSLAHIDAANKADYEARTAVNREQKAAQAEAVDDLAERSSWTVSEGLCQS